MRADLLLAILAGFILVAYPVLLLAHRRIPWLRDRVHYVHPAPMYSMVLIGMAILIRQGPTDYTGWLVIACGCVGALLWRKTQW